MININPIPAFKDNYFWLLDDGERAWVVDPGDAAPVREQLSVRGLQLEGILLTHWHCRVSDECLVHNRRPLLLSREVLRAALAEWNEAREC
jgi:hypothetical protein